MEKIFTDFWGGCDFPVKQTQSKNRVSNAFLRDYLTFSNQFKNLIYFLPQLLQWCPVDLNVASSLHNRGDSLNCHFIGNVVTTMHIANNMAIETVAKVVKKDVN